MFGIYVLRLSSFIRLSRRVMSGHYPALFMGEKFALKQKQVEYACRDGYICYIKHGAEEDKIAPFEEGNPFGEVAPENGKIEHIHYFALQEGCVASPFG